MKLAVIGSNMVDLCAYIHRMPAPGETLEVPDFTIKRLPPRSAVRR